MLHLLNRFDNFSGLRHALSMVAEKRDGWAGIPMPLKDHKLIVSPKYPLAKPLEGILDDPKPEPDAGADDIKLRNVFWSTRHRAVVYVVDDLKTGKVCMLVDRNNRIDFEIMTMGASVVWGIEQEARALNLLGTLLPHHAFKSYLLTGMFLETSKISGVTYLFRKLRPTIAMNARVGASRYQVGAHAAVVNDRIVYLAALCLHTIGYYEDTWAGAMCPTDDVISHLMLMRGDEHRFWRDCNHHPMDRPQAGI